MTERVYDAERVYDIGINAPEGKIPKSLKIQEMVRGRPTGTITLYKLDRIEQSEHEGFKKVVYRLEKVLHKIES